uniref:LAGLIDADG endonuclease n=1 Tax=Cordyceps cicadae TaxID=218633 RepID=A0A481S127_9HYPO|nr:LAGLIDADG endonuclease [Cordyceps cicadae]QBG64877.1 LAGLIDADG endonuclease [Cordyceps cicadae]
MNLTQHINDLSSIILFVSTRILFAIRSTKGITRLSPFERATIKLPNETKEVLVGILLGDAHIARRSSTGNSRLVYSQTAIKHKNYFDYVYSFFYTYCANDYIPQSRLIVDNRTKKTYSAISFTTMQLPCFNEFRELFYNSEKKKIIPENIEELLTPCGLAFWIMDDGSRQGNGLHISVYGFIDTDVDKLMFTLQNKFNLKCSVHYNRDKKPRIYIFKESIDTLITLVKPYFIKDMLYKLGL